jgi:hypothetical protein
MDPTIIQLHLSIDNLARAMPPEAREAVARHLNRSSPPGGPQRPSRRPGDGYGWAIVTLGRQPGD